MLLNPYILLSKLSSFSFISSSAVTTGRTITIPATAAIGDLAVIFEDIDTNVVIQNSPTGWERIVATSAGNSSGHCYYKILGSGDPGATITSNNTETSRYMLCLIWRPNTTINTVTTGDVNGEATTSNPILQTVNVSGLQTPLIVMAHLGNRSFQSITAPSYSPTETGSVSNGTAQKVYYTIFNVGSTPADTTVDMGDAGSQVLQSWYIQFT